MESIVNVHDKFFHETFTRKDIAESFFKHYLPQNILANIDLNTLSISKDSFIDKELTQHASDILYSVEFGKNLLYLYLLIVSIRVILKNGLRFRYCGIR